MGSWVEQHWESTIKSGTRRSARRPGPYLAYLPDPLLEAPLVLSSENDRLAASAERAVRAVVGDAHDLAGIARFLLRSEAIASSRIEGIAPSVKQVAMAELGSDEPTPDIKEMAQLVANNITVVERARTELAHTNQITIAHLTALQTALLSDEPRKHGIRQVQNWIGVSDSPIDATFVPPPPDAVPALMEDLVQYLATASHAPLIQAALAHAQFETIHPFIDGNGRVGRSLIHTVLTRRGLTPGAVLPVSMVLSTLSDEYVNGLTAYRQVTAVGSPEFHAGRAEWISVFLRAVEEAAQQASSLGSSLANLREEWDTRFHEWRTSEGRTRALRSDSAASLILKDLPSTPVLTSTSVRRIHDVSAQAASTALEELCSAGILRRSRRQRIVLYQCDDVLNLATLTERLTSQRTKNVRGACDAGDTSRKGEHACPP